jgi:hypothetical protein
VSRTVAPSASASDYRTILGPLLDLPGVRAAEVEKFGEDLAGVRLRIAPAAGADYGFELYVYEDGEPQISARLLSDPDAYFWYRPFEIDDFSGGDARLTAFRATAAKLLESRTVVVQVRGLLFDSFTLFCEASAGRERVYSISGLRLGGCRGPAISGRRHEYASPALAASH